MWFSTWWFTTSSFGAFWHSRRGDVSLAPKYQMAKHQAVTPSLPVPCKSLLCHLKAPQSGVAPGYYIAYIDEVGAGRLRIVTLMFPYGRTVDVQAGCFGKSGEFPAQLEQERATNFLTFISLCQLQSLLLTSQCMCTVLPSTLWGRQPRTPHSDSENPTTSTLSQVGTPVPAQPFPEATFSFVTRVTKL